MSEKKWAWISILVAVIMVGGSTLAFLPGSALASPSAARSSPSPLAPVQGATTHPAVASSSNNVAGSNATISVFLNFKSGIGQYASDVQTVGSPFFRQYLTPGQIGSVFGVPTRTYDQVASYFQSFGLTVQTYPDQVNLNLLGTPLQVEEAFHTTLQAEPLQVPGGNATTVFVNTAPLLLPNYISQLVSGITGLDGALVPNQIVQYGANVTALAANDSLNALTSSSPISNRAALNITYGNFTWAPLGGIFGNFQFLFPGTLPYVVGANNLWSGLDTIASEPDQGQGITIAVTEVGCVPQGVITSFGQQLFGDASQVTGRLTQIGVNIPNFRSCVNDGFAWGWTVETELDIEYIAAMAPQAHIVLVATSNDQLAGFDPAYAAITNYLSTGSSCQLPSYIQIFSGPQAGSCSISLTSNSHGFYSTQTAFSASPFDVLVQENLVSEMSAHGVTEFFATGDGAGTDGGSILQTGRPSEVPNVVSVGGGQITTSFGGNPFPMTGVLTRLDGLTMEVAPAQGIYSYTYWDCGGQCGGSYGSSTFWQQPWWQNGLDVYSSGTEIEPVVSNVASFNLTVWDGSGWILLIGGTSFATPITAGEWVLVEEQAVVAGLSPFMGNINPLIYALHNAQEAGALSQDAFSPMVNIGRGWDWGPADSYDWAQFNTSQLYPQDQNLPWWFPTLSNPAGVGFSYLGGFGVPLVTVVTEEAIGQLAKNSLLVPSLAVLEQTPGGLEPVTTLTAGQEYHFSVLTSSGAPADYVTITAYSGGTGVNVYGGGTQTVISTSDGEFNYTPVYAPQGINANATEYGYFLVSVTGFPSLSAEQAFQQFAVAEPLASGTLTLGVETPYGLQTSMAEVTAFNDLNLHDTYTLGQLGVVELNGVPVTNALVQQVAINISYIVYSGDPFVFPSQFASGVTIGQYLTDTAGQFYYWTNALNSANNGPVYTQVFELQATYDGLTSNSVIVYVEPQAGFFTDNLNLNPAGTALVGNVSFHDMKYLNSLNVSIGSSPGQYFTETFLPNTTFEGTVAVDLTPLPRGPVVVTLTGEGQNTIHLPYSFYLTSAGGSAYGNPIIWTDPTAYLPSTLTGPTGVVSGNQTFVFQGTSLEGASAVLELVSPEGVTVLDSGWSGSYTLDTASLQDGWYSVQYVESSDGAQTVRTVTFYSDNQQASSNQLIATLNGELASDQSEISSLESQLKGDAASINTLQQEVSSLESSLTVAQAAAQGLQTEVTQLTGQVSSLETQASSLRAEIATLQQELSSSQNGNTALEAELQSAQTELSLDNQTIATLNGQLSSDRSTLQSDQQVISAQNATITQLKTELNGRSAGAPAPVYSGNGGTTLWMFVGMALIAGLLGGVVIGRRRKVPDRGGAQVGKRAAAPGAVATGSVDPALSAPDESSEEGGPDAPS